MLALVVGLLAWLPNTSLARVHRWNHTRPSSCYSVCGDIENRLPGRVSFPDDMTYNHSISSYYSALERDLSPGCVFTPTSTDDVSQFMKIVTADRHYSPPFAIRSGGHKYFAGAANIQGGITVDMRGMQDTTLSPDHSYASIGGGAIWNEDVFPLLVQNNLIAAGARLPGLGIGGFISGGGLTYLARRNGWGCDTMVGYEVVLANGDVVNATAESNSDLWLALKGGSNNFGIVTHFMAETYPQGKMFGGVIGFNYTPEILDAQASAFSNFMQPANFDDKAMMGLLVTYENGVSLVSNSLFYLDPVKKPAPYESFLAIPGQVSNDLIVDTVLAVVNDFGSFTPPSLKRVAEINYSFKNGDASVYSELFKIYNKTLPHLVNANIAGSGIQWLIQPQPVTPGNNSLGLPANVTDMVIVNIVVGWNNIADDGFMYNFLNSLMDKHINYLASKDLFIPFVYLNYAGSYQDPIGSYGAKNKAHLQATSRKYDPTGVFQRQVPGGFKLFT